MLNMASNPTDTVFLRDLQVQTRIGVYDWERTQLRPLLLDLTFGIDVRAAADDDDVDKTIDYAAVAQQCHEFAASRDDKLLETFAETLAVGLLQRWPAEWLEMTVNKPGAVPAANVGITLRRDRADLTATAKTVSC